LKITLDVGDTSKNLWAEPSGTARRGKLGKSCSGVTRRDDGPLEEIATGRGALVRDTYICYSTGDGIIGATVIPKEVFPEGGEWDAGAFAKRRSEKFAPKMRHRKLVIAGRSGLAKPETARTVAELG